MNRLLMLALVAILGVASTAIAAPASEDQDQTVESSDQPFDESDEESDEEAE